MEYIYTAIVLSEAGTEITERTLGRTLESAGVDVDSERVKALNSALEDVDIQEAIEEEVGTSKGADEYTYTALLLSEAGTKITERTLGRTLESAGVDVDSERVKALNSALEDVDIQEAIEKATAPQKESESADISSDTSGGQSRGRIVSSLTSKVEREDETSDSVPDFQKEANSFQNKASDYYDAGEYERAIESYESAIRTYEKAKKQATDEEQITTLKQEVTATQEKLEVAEHRLSQLNTVRDPLTNAESSFQTAIAQHVQNNKAIPASRDYRQAADQYEQALTALDECEFDIFGEVKSITVSVNLEVSQISEKLVAWQRLSENELEALSDAGIGALTELQDAGNPVITELLEQGAINEELANRLHAALWWHGDDKRTFTSSQAIERQRDRAEQGQQMLR